VGGNAVSTFGSWRNALINFTGVMGLGVMSVALMLAVRPPVFEPFMGGLDKMYRLHKWLGISGLVFVILHWLLKQVPGWSETLKIQPQGKPIDLVYVTASPYKLAIDKLRLLAREAGVTLHGMVEANDGRLTAQRLCELVPDWRSADIWFCGPTGFGHALRVDMVAPGCASNTFHAELFDMR